MLLNMHRMLKRGGAARLTNALCYPLGPRAPSRFSQPLSEDELEDEHAVEPAEGPACA